MMDLTGDARRMTAFARAAGDAGIPLKALDLGGQGLEEVYKCDAILLRPDQFIAWAGRGGSEDANDILSKAIAS